MPDIELPYRFQPREYQKGAIDALNKGCKRLVCCWHRGSGKDLLFLNWIVCEAMRKKAVYIHGFPDYSQGKKAIWESIHDDHTGEPMAYLDHIPPALIKRKNSQDMVIEFINGSIYRVMGLDGKNAQSARGQNPYMVIFSEYAYMDPSAYRTLEPRISQNNGIAIFLSTPCGQNHFYELYNYARRNEKSWYSSLLTLADTKSLPLSHLESLRDQGFSDEWIEQEYFCSFTRGIDGVVYGRGMLQARQEKRIGNVPHDPNALVHTAWDLGYADAMAIICFQLIGQEVHVIDYIEEQGLKLVEYIQKLRDKPYQYGTHYAPHDIDAHSAGTGISGREVAATLGFNFTKLDTLKITTQDGLEAGRGILHKCWFDAGTCKHLIKCLESYHYEFDQNKNCYKSKPRHDWSSHGADAMKHLAIACRTWASPVRAGPSDAEVEMLYDRYQPRFQW